MHVILLVLLAVAVAQSVAARTELNQDKRLAKLQDLVAASSHGYAELSGEDVKYFYSVPRNYSLVVVATALDGRGVVCDPCRKFKSVFNQVAESHRANNDGSARLFFALVDFINAREFFDEFKQNTAPLVYHFEPSNEASSKPTHTIFRMQTLDVDDFKHWVEESTGVPITIFTPPDYTKLAMNLGMLLGVLMFVKLAFAHFYALLTNPLPWMVASLLFVINMNSGYMWNQIRNAPFSGMSRDGKLEIISGGFQSQYQVESQVVGMLYAMCAALFIVLIKRVPDVQGKLSQRMVIYASTFSLLFFYSVLMLVFRLKNGGYPFRLLL